MENENQKYLTLKQKIISFRGTRGSCLNGGPWVGCLHSMATHCLEASLRCQVLESLRVGELESVSIWQRDGQVCLSEAMPSSLQDTPRLEGKGRLPWLARSPGPAVLAVTHNGVGVPMYTEGRAEVQAHVVAQVQHEALGIGAILPTL